MAEAAPRRIAVVGAESSGKTTLARDLAAALGGACLPEYARAYFAARGGTDYTLDDVIAIAQGQHAGEDDPARWQGKAGGWLVCDTNALVCKVWAEVRFGHCPPAIEACWRPGDYLLHLLPKPDIPWEPDPLRENPHNRAALFERYRAALQAAGARFAVVGGTRAERVAAALAALPPQAKA